MGFTSKYAKSELMKTMQNDADSDSSSESKRNKIKIKASSPKQLDSKNPPLKGGKRGNLGARYQEIR